MYRFQNHAPLDTTVYEPTPHDDRSGTPLSQGFVLTLISVVAAECCSPATLDVVEQVDADSWYHGQLLESVLQEFEAKDPQLPAEIGKNIYYTLRSQFTAMGLKTPEDVISTLPMLWQHVTRGASGEFRTHMVGPRHARLELEQPYNCRFEHGAIQGALEAFDATDVRLDHQQCMRDGASCCIIEAQWNMRESHDHAA